MRRRGVRPGALCLACDDGFSSVSTGLLGRYVRVKVDQNVVPYRETTLARGGFTDVTGSASVEQGRGR